MFLEILFVTAQTYTLDPGVGYFVSVRDAADRIDQKSLQKCLESCSHDQNCIAATYKENGNLCLISYSSSIRILRNGWNAYVKNKPTVQGNPQAPVTTPIPTIVPAVGSTLPSSSGAVVITSRPTVVTLSTASPISIITPISKSAPTTTSAIQVQPPPRSQKVPTQNIPSTTIQAPIVLLSPSASPNVVSPIPVVSTLPPMAIQTPVVVTNPSSPLANQSPVVSNASNPNSPLANPEIQQLPSFLPPSVDEKPSEYPDNSNLKATATSVAAILHPLETVFCSKNLATSTAQKYSEC